jgi:hypothetical protein
LHNERQPVTNGIGLAETTRKAETADGDDAQPQQSGREDFHVGCPTEARIFCASANTLRWLSHP